MIQTEEGLARNNSGSYSYEYNLADHQGNVRFSFNQHPDTKLLQSLQSDNYYAFGKRKVVRAGSNKYLYNGKEIQEELGEQYDYGARFYDPVVGRFNVLDRFSEKYFDVNPYQYCVNNPIRFIDINGDSVGVDKSILNNWALNYAFKLFAGTKAGRAFLGKFAHKGQKLYGHT